MSSFEYTEEVAHRYDAAVPVGEGEIDFYLQYAREAQARGEPALELACGTGRIAIPIAHEGISLTGLDTSAPMLEIARQKTSGAENPRWIEGDMSTFDLGERFGLITIPAGSFHLLPDTEDQIASLRSIERHLTPDGRLAMDLINPNIPGLGETLTSRAGVLTRRADREFRDPATGLMAHTWESQEYHPSTQELVVNTVVDETDDSEKVVSRRYAQMTLRLLFRFEVEHLLARCGLALEAIYGDFRHAPYRGTSSQMLVVARRAE